MQRHLNSKQVITPQIIASQSVMTVERFGKLPIDLLITPMQVNRSRGCSTGRANGRADLFTIRLDDGLASPTLAA